MRISRSLTALLAGSALLLSGCATDNGATATEEGGADAIAGAENGGTDNGGADGLCALLDPEGLQEYHDWTDFRAIGATESDEGYQACVWEADGEDLSGMRYTITLMDWQDERFEGKTGQEGFDTFMRNRLEEDTRATWLERYQEGPGDNPIDRDSLEWVDDVAYTNELYVLSGEYVLRLDGNPFGSSQSGRMVGGGYFPVVDPASVT